MRWLTFDELVGELQITPGRAKKLIRQGRIVGYCVGNKRRLETDWRYVDPSETVKRAITLQENVFACTWRPEIFDFPCISTVEVAALAGIKPITVDINIHRKKLKPHKMGRFNLFTPRQVREFLLRRERKEPRSRRARCESILKWCLESLDKEPAMTRAEVDRDDRLEGMLRKLLRLPEPERTTAIAEFWRRYKLCRDVVEAIAPGAS